MLSLFLAGVSTIISTLQILKSSFDPVLKTTCKLNLKLQADLDNIRVQYSKKVHSEKELTDLISELYVKLKQASEFYNKLEQNYPEIARKFDE